jgi:hypothetical protein
MKLEAIIGSVNMAKTIRAVQSVQAETGQSVFLAFPKAGASGREVMGAPENNLEPVEVRIVLYELRLDKPLLNGWYLQDSEIRFTYMEGQARPVT